MNSTSAFIQTTEIQLLLQRRATQFVQALRVPSQPDTNEFCTPGHHAGKLYRFMFMAQMSRSDGNQSVRQIKEKRI